MKIRLLSCLVAAALLFSSCGAVSGGRNGLALFEENGASAAPSAGQGTDAPMFDTVENEKSTLEDSGAVALPEERKIIWTADYVVEVKDFNNSLERLESEAASWGGYVQYTETWGNAEEGTASARLVLRIPAGKMEETSGLLDEIGNVTRASKGSEDVTLDYFDLDTRLKVLEAQENRLLELLERAQTVEEILQIETELSRLRVDIEQLTGRLKHYDNQVDYATVNVRLEQTRDYTVQNDGFFSWLWETVKDSGKSLVQVLKWLVSCLILLLPYILIGLVVFLLIRRHFRRKRAARMQAPPDTGEEDQK